MLRYLPGLTIALFLGPVVAGLLGTLLPAFGYLPVLGGEELSLEPWKRLFAAPGLWPALRATLISGFASTAIALALTVLIFAAGHGTAALTRIKRAMVPLLAVPHLAIAVGLAFLIAPSGWLIRLVSPWPTGWHTPPDVPLIQDPLGLALAFGLVLKETPFLILMTFGALGQIGADGQLRMARSLGYGPVQAWLKVVLPQVYPQIRLPVYAVLAFALSVVDMAIVLGPTAPPTLAPLVFRWFYDPDLMMRFQAAAGATLQLALVVLAIALWRGAEAVVARLARPWLVQGSRGGAGAGPRLAAWTGVAVLFGFSGGCLLGLALWSSARRWPFPELLPTIWSLERWSEQVEVLAVPTGTTLVIGLVATLVALALVAGCLENETRRQRPGQRALALIYVPLLVPQIGFLFGVQVLFLWLRLSDGWLALIWAHLLFVLPYVFLTLADPYRSLDPRYARSALALGRPPWIVWLRIKAIMLLRPLTIAAAVGFAVSVAQFLPTLFAGGGRFATLTTETLSVAAGGDRRLIGQFGIALAMLPFAGFALALAVVAWRFRDRRAMRTGS